MKLSPLIFSLALLSLLSCSAQANKKLDLSKVEAQTLDMKGPTGNYRFSLNIPKEWQSVYSSPVPNGFIGEFTPNGQSLASWKDMITLRFDGIAVATDYQAFHNLMDHKGPLNEKTCKDFRRSDFTNHGQHGLKTVELYMECPSLNSTPGFGEAMLYKYILAGDKIGLITIWRSWKITNEQDLIEARSQYTDYTNLFRQAKLNKL
ncbi:MAG: hypothetical protein O3C63_04160 [Cyanobacteria bacterium]|nr:hypothetical protein [Cyanobacteriota bacterium]